MIPEKGGSNEVGKGIGGSSFTGCLCAVCSNRNHLFLEACMGRSSLYVGICNFPSAEKVVPDAYYIRNTAMFGSLCTDDRCMDIGENRNGRHSGMLFGLFCIWYDIKIHILEKGVCIYQFSYDMIMHIILWRYVMYYLDANALYWYFGRDKLPLLASDDSIDVNKLRAFLDEREDKSLPASVLVEVIVHFRDQPNVIKSILKFLEDKKLRIYNNCQYYSFSPEELTVISMLSDVQLNARANQLLTKKMEIEESFIYVFLETVKMVYADFYIKQKSNIDASNGDKILSWLGKDFSLYNRAERKSQIHQGLIDGYNIGKEEKTIREIYIELLAEECIISREIIDMVSKYLENEPDLISILQQAANDAVSDGITKESVMQVISTSLRGDKAVIQNSKSEIIQIYRRQNFTEHQAKYIGEMFERWMISGQKLWKNDIFDMFFVGAMDKQVTDFSLPVVVDQRSYLLTFDKKVEAFIEKENYTNFSIIQRFY